jgi:transposase
MRLTDEKKDHIVLLDRLGWLRTDIGKELNVPSSTVKSVLKRFVERGTLDNKRASGRPKKLSNRNQRSLCRLTRTNRRFSLAKVTALYNAGAQTQVSEVTARRILHENGMFGHAAAKKLQLPHHIRVARLRWCRSRHHLGDDYWRRVIFSDETRVGLSSDGRVYVWRGKDERFKPECVISHSTSRQSVMYWGFITYDGTGLLIRCSNRMNAEEYINVLNEAAIQCASEDFDLVFMQDNAPIHRARSVDTWMSLNSIEILPWPAYSPDLNPIENLWAYMKDKINKLEQPPSNLAELDVAVRDVWRSITLEYVQTLYGSMTRRLTQCITKRGFPTKY